MKLSTADFYPIRWSILAACASALISAVILYSSGEYVQSAQNELGSAQSRLNDARNRLATASQDQENMAIYAGEYGALLERNIIGDDQRLDWMEGLEQLRQKNLVADFRYRIAPQKNYASQPPIDSGNFEIHYSEMKLQFDLLHETQLLNFFAALRTGIKGRYQLESCTLQRPGTTDTNGHGKCATPDDEICHARFPHLNPLDETTSHSTKLQTTAAKSLVIPQAGEEANEPLREFRVKDPDHPTATAYLKAECSGGWITLKNRNTP